MNAKDDAGDLHPKKHDVDAPDETSRDSMVWNDDWDDNDSTLGDRALESQRILGHPNDSDGVIDEDEEAIENEIRANLSSKVTSSLHAYKVAGIALIIALISFTINTEFAQYVQGRLHWQKPYCMLYLHHSSWSLMGPLQFLFLRLTSPSNLSTGPLLRSHIHSLRTTAAHILSESPYAMRPNLTPQKYMLFVIGTLTITLTMAASTWFLAVSLTSTSDVTAMYNCSAFFAYAFSIPLLGERFRKDKAFAVGLAICGVFLMAWATNDDSGSIAAHRRFIGDAIIACGAVLYGLYEVLYKARACAVSPIGPYRSILFSNACTTGIGLFTMLFMWIPLPILHFTGLEVFELPSPRVALFLGISILSNIGFTASFLTMVSLTSPVLSSVGAMLTIFIIAIVDWFLGSAFALLTVVGGILIIIAFVLLSYASWLEIKEDKMAEAEQEG